MKHGHINPVLHYITEFFHYCQTHLVWLFVFVECSVFCRICAIIRPFASNCTEYIKLYLVPQSVPENIYNGLQKWICIVDRILLFYHYI